MATTPASDEEPPAFRLGREDVVEVSVYRDPELTRTVPIRPDGRISLPLVGEVEADGLTPDELRTVVVERLGAFVQSPAVVSVIVREVNSARFYVVGEVGRPGAYPLRGRTSLLQALALAGGFGEFSARDGLAVVRGLGGRRFAVSWEELTMSPGLVWLQPGDTVVVR
jgi:polysaccharide export outer membrane protein